MTEELPERLAAAESVLQPGAVVQLQGDADRVPGPLAAAGRRHHLQLGVIGQVGEPPRQSEVEHVPLKLQIVFAGVEVLPPARVLKDLPRFVPVVTSAVAWCEGQRMAEGKVFRPRRADSATVSDPIS